LVGAAVPLVCQTPNDHDLILEKPVKCCDISDLILRPA